MLASIAAFAGLLSHESAWIAVAALPIAGWWRTRDLRRTLPWALAAAVVMGAWAVGYGIALRHGVVLPPGLNGVLSLERVAKLLALTLAATANLEDLPSGIRTTLLLAHAALGVAALALLARPSGRARLRGRALPIALGIAAFFLGSLPLAVLLPDWNAWRAWMPALALGVSWGALLACASPRLAGAFVALRLIALLIAPSAPAVVTRVPLPTASHMSFARLVRLQRTVESARKALVASHPTLPAGATVLYWQIPRLAEVAFQEQTAARTWYRDSTLTWDSFGGAAGFARHPNAVVDFVMEEKEPAQLVPPRALAHFARGIATLQRQDLAGADAEFESTLVTSAGRAGALQAAVYNNRARIQAAFGNLDRADSFNRVGLSVNPIQPEPWGLAAKIALARGDRAAAMVAARHALVIDPRNAEAVEVLRQIEAMR